MTCSMFSIDFKAPFGFLSIFLPWVDLFFGLKCIIVYSTSVLMIHSGYRVVGL